jgi:putative endopeptidase
MIFIDHGLKRIALGRFANQARVAAIGLALIAVCSMAAEPAGSGVEATHAPSPVSGVDLRYVDPAVRPQDDLYRAVNGKWLDTFEIPADRAHYGVFDELRDRTLEQLKGIIEDISGSTDVAPGTDPQKIRDLYLSFMDEAKVEELGLRPLSVEFARVDALIDRSDMSALIAHFNRIGVAAPYRLKIGQVSNRDSARYMVEIGQSGLGLPSRDYYLDDRFKDTRMKYLAHVERMLSMAGEKDAATAAKYILSLETAMATVQWATVENSDPLKTYNRIGVDQLSRLAPGYDWDRWLSAAGIEGKGSFLNVSQPSYLTGFSNLVATTPMPVWKSYFRWRLLSDAAPYLPKAYVDECFAFNGSVLRSIPQNLPRWKRGLALIEGSIGEGLGKLYVERYFPRTNRARMQGILGNLIAAFTQSIDTLEWMGPKTRQQAQAKLAKLTTKIGYPEKWRDYSALSIAKDDLLGNRMRARAFEYDRQIGKLGQPIDRDEWDMTPQTVNAYYNPEHNEIVFPAAILQRPLFDVGAEDAVNYGGIGAVIGHEISHAFDDEGGQFDGDGHVRPWLTRNDVENLRTRTKALIAQYEAYEPVPGFHVDGALTLRENVADNSGLAIAYKAYKLSLNGRAAAVIDGLSGQQRLYYSYAQVWRAKSREADTIRVLEVYRYAPENVRGFAPLRNQPGFYEAFGVKEGDKMYLAPGQRVIIW